MHEYSIVAALIDQVHQIAAERGASRVQRLHVQIGELAGVELDLLQTAYDTFRERTICERAELVIQPVAARWACTQCGGEIEPGGILRCPSCERPARLIRGDEIILERIEMEMDSMEEARDV